MIGTPIVTFHPDEEERGWDKVQPTSSVAALLFQVGGTNMTEHCVAKNKEEYIDKVSR